MAKREIRRVFSIRRKAHAEFLFVVQGGCEVFANRIRQTGHRPLKLSGSCSTGRECEQLLRQEGSGASLSEALTFYLAHHKKAVIAKPTQKHPESRSAYPLKFH